MSKKSKKVAKLPKRFAGVKISKKVRKGPLGEFVASPAGQLVIAEIVAAAGGALMKHNLDKHPKRKQALGDAAAATEEKAADAVHSAGEAGANLTLAITEAARTFGRVLRHGDDVQTSSPRAQAAPPTLQS